MKRPKRLRSRRRELNVVKKFLSLLGDNPSREGLKETPRRVLDAWQFWCSGYDQDPADVLKTFEDGAEAYDQLIFQAGIPTWSHCEHHAAMFWGTTHIAYVPNGRIIGLSKLSKLVEIFARRLQVQERLCNQVADALMDSGLNPKGVGVVMQMRHACMESRGIQKVGTVTMTSALRGCIKNEPECRAEFMSFVTTASQGLSKL